MIMSGGGGGVGVECVMEGWGVSWRGCHGVVGSVMEGWGGVGLVSWRGGLSWSGGGVSWRGEGGSDIEQLGYRGPTITIYTL